MAVGVAWFLVAYGIVMPHFNGGTNQAGIFYGELGDSPADLIQHDADRSDDGHRPPRDNDALGYARDLLAPCGFLPLLAPRCCCRRAPVLRQHPDQRSTSSRHPASTTRRSSWRCRPGARSKAWPGCRSRRCAASASASSPRRRWRRRSPGASRRSARDTAPATGRSQGNARQEVLDAPWRSVPVRCGRGGDVLHRPAPQPPRADLHVPQPVDPANWGVAGAAPARPRQRPRARGGRLGRHRPHHPRPRGHGRSTCSTICSTNGEFEVVSDEEGILVARRVRAAGAAGALIRARWVSISRLTAPTWPAETVRAQIDGVASGGCQSGGRSSAASAASTPLTNRPLSSVEKRLASSTASSMHDGDRARRAARRARTRRGAAR